VAIGKVEVNNIATSKVKFRESPHGKLKGTVKENKISKKRRYPRGS